MPFINYELFSSMKNQMTNNYNNKQNVIFSKRINMAQNNNKFFENRKDYKKIHEVSCIKLDFFLYLKPKPDKTSFKQEKKTKFPMIILKNAIQHPTFVIFFC